MRFGILGTGTVGRTVGSKLAELGHDVMIGTRDVDALMARTDTDYMGNPPYAKWAQDHQNIKLGTFAEAAAHGETLVNATNGAGTLDALQAAGDGNLDGKVLIHISNPLDFSRGMPPTLTVCNTDSLAEQIQRAHPGARVVKTLNTVNAYLMVDPSLVNGGDHTMFVSGNHPQAKAQVTELLQAFGWADVMDLGDITTARGPEMLLPLWVRLMPAMSTAMFNIKVVR